MFLSYLLTNQILPLPNAFNKKCNNLNNLTCLVIVFRFLILMFFCVLENYFPLRAQKIPPRELWLHGSGWVTLPSWQRTQNLMVGVNAERRGQGVVSQHLVGRRRG